jgi:hypothetical protein
MNKEMQDILQEADIANFIKLLELRWHAYAKKMNKKQIFTATIDKEMAKTTDNIG